MTHVAVVVPAVSSDLTTYEGGLFVRLAFAFQFYLSQYKAFILTPELIDLPCMTTIRRWNKPARLFYDAGLANSHEGFCFGNRNLLFPFKARKTCLVTGSLDGEIALVATDANPDGTSATRSNIALADAGGVHRLAFEVTDDEKLSFYFCEFHLVKRLFAGEESFHSSAPNSMR